MASRSFQTRIAGAGLLMACMLSTAACNREAATVRSSFQSGEPIPAGPLLYNIVQTEWRTQLGDMLKLRTPQNRFLLITISAANKSRQPISIPFAVLEGENRKEYPEIENGESVDNWFGLIREISPGETRQGRLLFDVPLTSYRLRLTDGGEPGSERLLWVDIPLSLNSESGTNIANPQPVPGLPR